MDEERESQYIAFRSEDQIGREFYSAEEAAIFFGVKLNSLKAIARDRHSIKGTREEVWKIFPSDMSIIDVESELERRL